MAQETQSVAGSSVQSPAALLLAERVNRLHVEGHFDEASQAWSNRDFACASAKKHNEAM